MRYYIYCLTGTRDVPGVPAYHISSSNGAVQDGPCEGHSGSGGSSAGGGVTVSTRSTTIPVTYFLDIDSDAAGNLYASTYSGPYRLYKLAPDGQVSTVHTFSSSGSEFSVTADSTIYLATGNSIMKISGGVTTTHATGFASNVYDVVASENGDVYAIYSGSIDKVSPAGTRTNVTTTTYSHITVGPSGVLYTIGNGSGYPIYKIASSGGATLLADSFSWASSMSVAELGDLYVVDSGENRIIKITPSGQKTVVAGTGSEGADDGNVLEASFDAAQLVTVDKAGNTKIYIGQYYSPNIRIINL